MQTEVLNATNKVSYINVSATAKASLGGPVTQDSMIQSKKDIHALVTAKTIKVRDNMHLLLGTVNSFPNPQLNGSAIPTAYHNFDTLQIHALQL